MPTFFSHFICVKFFFFFFLLLNGFFKPKKPNLWIECQMIIQTNLTNKLPILNARLSFWKLEISRFSNSFHLNWNRSTDMHSLLIWFDWFDDYFSGIWFFFFLKKRIYFFQAYLWTQFFRLFFIDLISFWFVFKYI